MIQFDCIYIYNMLQLGWFKHFVSFLMFAVYTFTFAVFFVAGNDRCYSHHQDDVNIVCWRGWGNSQRKLGVYLKGPLE